MFGLGISEIVLLLALALIVIGPKKLPEVAKALGKGYGEFRRAFGELKESVNIDDIDDKKTSASKADKIYEENWKEDIETAEAEHKAAKKEAPEPQKQKGTQEQQSSNEEKTQ